MFRLLDLLATFGISDLRPQFLVKCFKKAPLPAIFIPEHDNLPLFALFV
jgi:hypothetical protein